MGPQKSFLKCLWCLLIVSVVVIIFGLLLMFFWSTIFNYLIDNSLILTPQSGLYQLWKKFPVAYPMDIYLFNWTNPEDIYNTSVKPKFKQVGPYRFAENKQNANITWNNNGTVTYRHQKFWHFINEPNNGDLEDLITTINPVALGAAYAARTWHITFLKSLSFSLSNFVRTPHITHTANQMLFEGYQDPLLHTVKNLPIVGSDSNHDRFGWFYMRNGSTDVDGVFNMATGERSRLGKLYSWNYLSESPYFDGKCSKFNGSAGEFFERNLDKNTVTLFSPSLCRMLTLKFVGESKVDNVLGYKYALEPDMLDNGTLYPENKCYCNGECVPSGVFNISSCRAGSPAFVSLPHFLNADHYFLDLIEGLQPEKNKHELYVIIEPTTGIPLDSRVRLQLNFLLQPLPLLEMYENVAKAFFPMIWFEQKVKIPDHELFKLKLLLNMQIICYSIGFLLICVALIGITWILYKIRLINIHLKNRELFMDKEMEGQTIPLKSL